MSQIILDIETFALDEAAQFIEEPTAPSNYKDPEKIAAYVADAKAKAIDRCALNLDLCRVVAIGWHRACDAEPIVLNARWDSDERNVLRAFFNHAEDATQIIGFNILHFDLPVLMRRAQYLGVEFPAIPLDRFRSPHLDLMEFLSFGDKEKRRSLDFYCKRFGIAVDDTTTGRDIDALVRADDWDGVATHCRADVEKTRALAARLGLWQAIERQEEVVL